MSKKRVSLLLTTSAAALVLFVLALFFLPIAGSVVHAKPVAVDQTDYKITSDTTYAIAPGVKERVLKTSTEAVATEAFVMEIEAMNKDVKIAAGYGNRKPGTDAGEEGWCLSPLTKQAQLYEQTHTGERVVGGINASLFNVGTGEPQSMLVMDGVKYQDMVWRPYLAIFNDGFAAIIGKNKDNLGNTDNNPTIEQAEADINKDGVDHGPIVQAIGGWFNLMEDGEVTEAAKADKGSNGGQYPRAAVGVKADGTVVFFQADGIQAPRSTGYTIKEMAYFMKHLGCKDALELDEGGSATYISRREGESRAVQRNISAGGVEREISTSILVASTAAPSGQFDHAVLTPNDEYFTPGSTIELSALAVDSAGQAVNSMPMDVEWKVEPSTAGSFSSQKVERNVATAVFTAAEGFENQEITIKLVRGESAPERERDGEDETENENADGAVGQTKLGIFEPDAFQFDSPVLNLGFGVTSDLGLKAFFESKEVKMHDGDVEWSAEEIVDEEEPETPKKDVEEYGKFHGLMFTVTDNWKISGSIKVTAKFKDNADFSRDVTVNIGLKPEILLDGGDTDGLEYEDDNIARLNNGTPENHFHEVQEQKDDGTTVTNKVLDDSVDLVTFYYGHGGKESMEQISKEDELGDLIRFGEYAVKFNWDFTKWDGKATEGACFGFAEDMYIDDSPTAIGLWIYAPEGTPNFWFRGQCQVESTPGSNEYGGTEYIDFTQQYVSGYLGGIEWTGWKYVSANISKYAGKKIKIPAGMSMRFMVTTSGCGRYRQSDPKTQIPVGSSDYKGWLLLDNYQFEYGSNTQDAVNPVIEDLKVAEHGDEKNRVDLKDGAVLKSNYLKFYAAYSDTQDTSPYNIGIAESGGNFWFDGVRYGGDTQKSIDEVIETEEGSEKQIKHIWRASRSMFIYLSNGEHRLDLKVKDDFGNEEIRTIYFTVAAEESKLDTLRIEADEKPIIGKDFHFKLYASNPSNLGTADLTLTVTPTFMQNVECTPADGFKIGPIKAEESKKPDDTTTQTPDPADSNVNPVGDPEPTPTPAPAPEEGQPADENHGTLDTKNGVFAVRIMRDGEEATETSEGLIATITLKIPADVSASSRLTWSAVATLTVKEKEDFVDSNDIGESGKEGEDGDDENGDAGEQPAPQPRDGSQNQEESKRTVHQVLRGFCLKPVGTAVFAELGIRSEDQIVGFGDGAIYITDEEGKPVKGANVYLLNSEEETEDTLLGTTGEDGKLVYGEAHQENNVFTAEQGRHTIYASLEKKEGDTVKDTLLSFRTEIVSYNPIKAPEKEEGKGQDYVYFVIYNSVKDMATEKNISWLAYLADSEGNKLMEQVAKIRYSTQQDMKDYTEADGTSVLMSYSLTNDATIVNNVQIADLKADTLYYYQVGDGKNWSPVGTFKTKPAKLEQANFFLLGDMQGDLGIVEKMNEAMKNDGVRYDFGIQTGDIVDNPNSYALWEETLKLISEGIYAESDFVHVIGNHEAEGDLTTAISRKTFGIPVGADGDFYSYEYGPVYVAVLNYTLDAQRLQEFGKWLVQDSKDTDCTWKIVVSHVPAYGTNPAGGTDKIYRSNLESYLVEAGVDFFFAGNDHSFARTEPVINEETVDEAKGVVHYIVGTAGEKKYAVDTQNLPFVKADQGFNAMYLSVIATKKGITVNAWNVAANGTASLYDTYTKGVEECETADHKLVYDSDADLFECEVCGRVFRFETDMETLSYYTGLVKDKKTGSVRYLLGGEFYKGPVNIAKDGKTRSYHFGPDYIGLNGVIETGGEKLEFSGGLFVPTDRIKDAGLAGENAYYIIGTDNTLRITGEGAIYDFEGLTDRPWGTIYEIVSIEIGKGITAIGKNSLREIPNVASFTFEEGSVLETIGYDSLREIGRDTKLERVVLPQSVKTIEPYAFRGCKIGMLVLPDGLESMHNSSFLWTFGLRVNVLEGSRGEELAKQYLASRYSLRHYIGAEKFESSGSGICVVEDKDKTTHTAYYYLEGKLVESPSEIWTAAKASVEEYNKLSKEARLEHPCDYDILKEAVKAHNEILSERNRLHAKDAGTAADVSAKEGE